MAPPGYRMVHPGYKMALLGYRMVLPGYKIAPTGYGMILLHVAKRWPLQIYTCRTVFLGFEMTPPRCGMVILVYMVALQDIRCILPG